MVIVTYSMVINGTIVYYRFAVTIQDEFRHVKHFDQIESPKYELDV